MESVHCMCVGSLYVAELKGAVIRVVDGSLIVKIVLGGQELIHCERINKLISNNEFG